MLVVYRTLCAEDKIVLFKFTSGISYHTFCMTIFFPLIIFLLLLIYIYYFLVFTSLTLSLVVFHFHININNTIFSFWINSHFFFLSKDTASVFLYQAVTFQGYYICSSWIPISIEDLNRMTNKILLCTERININILYI